MARPPARELGHVVTIAPVRVHDRELERELGTTVLRTIGYRARCRCGWKGDTWPTYRKAGFEGLWHAG